MSGIILQPRQLTYDEDDSDYDDDRYYQHHSSPPLELQNRDPMQQLEEDCQAQTQMDHSNSSPTSTVPIPDPKEPSNENPDEADESDLTKDTGLLYSSMIVTGVGVLLPMNAFTMASDYYMQRLPDYNIVFDINMAYLACNLIGVLFGNLFVETVAFHVRVMVGFSMALSALLCITIFDMLLELFTVNKGYDLTMAAVGISALGTAGNACALLFILRNGLKHAFITDSQSNHLLSSST